MSLWHMLAGTTEDPCYHDAEAAKVRTYVKRLSQSQRHLETQVNKIVKSPNPVRELVTRVRRADK